MTKWGIARLIAFLFVVAVASYAAYTINDTNIDRVETSELVACERVQLLRDQANGTNFLIYDTFKAIVDQQQAVIDKGTLTGTALKQAKASVKRSQKVVDTTVVTGPTDCNAAVKTPERYIPPAPEFIASGSARIAVARKRAEAIVTKAELGIPLYPPHQKNEKP